MKGVVFYDFRRCPARPSGITHGAGVAQTLEDLRQLQRQSPRAGAGMYPQILLDDAGRVAYTSFLEVLWKATAEHICSTAPRARIVPVWAPSSWNGRRRA